MVNFVPNDIWGERKLAAPLFLKIVAGLERRKRGKYGGHPDSVLSCALLYVYSISQIPYSA